MARPYSCHKWALGRTGGGNTDLDSSNYKDNQTQNGDIVSVFDRDNNRVDDYRWLSTSTDTADGYSVVRPTSMVSAQAGRWIRFASYDNQLKSTFDFGTYLPQTVANLAQLERLSQDVDMGGYDHNARYILDGGAY